MLRRGWIDGIRSDGRDCQLVCGGGPNLGKIVGKKGKIPEAIEKESTKKDVEMSDECMDGMDGSLSSCWCTRGYCKQYPKGSDLQN